MLRMKGYNSGQFYKPSGTLLPDLQRLDRRPPGLQHVGQLPKAACECNRAEVAIVFPAMVESAYLPWAVALARCPGIPRSLQPPVAHRTTQPPASCTGPSGPPWHRSGRVNTLNHLSKKYRAVQAHKGTTEPCQG